MNPPTMSQTDLHRLPAGERKPAIVAIDTETTGFRRTAGIVEIGAAILFPGLAEPPEGFSMRVNPGVPIEQYAHRVHRITDADLVGCPPPEAGLAMLLDWMRARLHKHGWTQYQVWAHSAAFDERMIRRTWPDGGAPCPLLPLNCSMALARHHAPWLPSHKLGDLAETLRLPQQPDHSAQADAMTCAFLVAGLT